jgi:hypothetical protein
MRVAAMLCLVVLLAACTAAFPTNGVVMLQEEAPTAAVKAAEKEAVLTARKMAHSLHGKSLSADHFLKLASTAVKQAKKNTKVHALLKELRSKQTAKSKAEAARERQIKGHQSRVTAASAAQAVRYSVSKAAAAAANKAAAQAQAKVKQQHHNRGHTSLGGSQEKAKQKEQKPSAAGHKQHNQVKPVKSTSSQAKAAEAAAQKVVAKKGLTIESSTKSTTPTKADHKNTPSKKTAVQPMTTDMKRLAATAAKVAQEHIFFSKLLGSVSKDEKAYAALRSQETASQVHAKQLQGQAGSLLKNLQKKLKLNVRKQSLGEGWADEKAQGAGLFDHQHHKKQKVATQKAVVNTKKQVRLPVAKNTENDKKTATVANNRPSAAAIATATASVAQSPVVAQLSSEVRNDKKMSAQAAAAEAEAQRVVAKENKQLHQATRSHAHSISSKSAEKVKQEKAKVGELKQVQAGLSKKLKQAPKGTHSHKTVRVAERMASAALKKEEQKKTAAETKLQQEKTKQHSENDSAKFSAEVAAGQEVKAAALAQRKAVAKAEAAASKVAASQQKLQAAQRDVVHDKAEKLTRTANAVPLARQALEKEHTAEKKLSSALEALAERAQTQGAAETRLDSQAQRLRAQTVETKNSIERQLDGLQGTSQRLGENKQAPHTTGNAASSKWVTGEKKEELVLSKEKQQLHAMATLTQQMSLEAAKIVENQHEAADETSHAEVAARVTSHSLLRSAGKTIKPDANFKTVKTALKKSHDVDHTALANLEAIHSNAMNSAAHAAASTLQTKAQVRSNDVLMNAISDDLLP